MQFVELRQKYIARTRRRVITRDQAQLDHYVADSKMEGVI